MSKILFDAYARTQSDSSFLSILDRVRVGITEDKAIIWLHGNGCFYETSFDRPLGWRDALRREDKVPHLLVFNPRGTGRSEGRTQLSYVIEDLTLFFQHVNPSSVVIGGHSMGGYFGLFGAAELQKAFPEIAINFISDRSIWTLESRISVKVEAGGYTGLSKAAMSLYIKSVINSPDWARDSFEALESLKGKVLIIFHKKDGVMLLKDSVYIGLSKAQQTKDYHILELTEEDPSIDAYPYPHNRALTDKENHILIAEIGQMLGIPTPGY